MARFLCIVLAAISVAPVANAQPERWAIIRGWDIGYYPATQGCLAFTAFEDTNFFIGFDMHEEVPALDITVLDSRWSSIEPMARYPVTLAFGDEPPWTLEMQGVMMDGLPGLNILIDASIDQSLEFIEEFQREMRMRWSYGDAELGEFTLRGSRRAFDEVLKCQRSFDARAQAQDTSATGNTNQSAVTD
ncbi:MAG: hypothetical protein AB3N11_16265 [Arenibacterium sp.]